MTDVLCYQGIQRVRMLKFLHRLCIQRHRDALLEPACDPGESCGDADLSDALATRVTDWCAVVVGELDRVIRDSPGMPADSLAEGDAMILFHQEAAMTQGLATVIDAVCRAFAVGQDSACDALLWQVLSQHFKAVMDQVDGLASESGVHRLKTRRRIDRLRKTLETERGASFASVSAAATALCAVVVARAMTNMPVKPSKMEQYLLEIEADSMTLDEVDFDHEPSLIDVVVSPELLVSMQQCLDRLSPELRQAVAIKQQWDGEPAFLRTEHLAGHYGFGWETVRKRARAAQQQLRECLEI